MKKGLIYGLSVAILAAGLLIVVNSASADSYSYSSSSSSASASASSSSSARVGSVRVSVDHDSDHDHDKNHKKSVKKLPATGSDMAIMLGLAGFASLVVFIGSRSTVKEK